MKLINWIVVVVLVMMADFAQAQLSSSAYTAMGIGEIHDRTTVNQAAMGDVGIGLPRVNSINTLNPAFLYLNHFTTIDVAFQSEKRSVKAENAKGSLGASGYKYLTFSFPIIPYRWTSSLSLNPYSSINYNLNAVRQVEGDEQNDYQIQTIGSGGLTEFRLSHGVKIHDQLAVGLRTSILFGFSEQKNIYSLTGQGFTGIANQVLIKEDYRGYDFGLGVAYNKRFGEEKILFAGLTYDLANDLNGTRHADASALNLLNELSELEDEQVKGQTSLPAKLGVGLGWVKQNEWNIGLDITYSAWKASPEFVAGERKYSDTFTAGLGMEYIPEFDDVDNYLARVRYRLGVKYEQLPAGIGTYSKNVNDFGINFGWSLPVRGLSTLNMAFKYGQRGTIEDNQVKESYFRFMLGATFNDRWFVRRKYN